MADLTGTNKGSIDVSVRRIETEDDAVPETWNPQMQTVLDNFAYTRDALDDLNDFLNGFKYVPVPGSIADALYAASNADHRALLRIDTTNNPVEVRLPSTATTGLQFDVVRINGVTTPVEDFQVSIGGAADYPDAWGFYCVTLDQHGNTYTGYLDDIGSQPDSRRLQKYDAAGTVVWDITSPSAAAIRRVSHAKQGTTLYAASLGAPCRLMKVDTNAGSLSNSIDIGGYDAAGLDEDVWGIAAEAPYVSQPGVIVGVGPSSHRIRKYTSGLLLAWSYPVPNTNGNAPTDLRVDPSSNAVVYAQPDGIRKLDSGGTLQWSVATGTGVKHIAIDASGHIYYARAGANVIGKLSPQGQPLWTTTVSSASGDALNGTIAVDGNGYVVAGTTFGEAWKIDPASGQALARSSIGVPRAYGDPTLREIAASPRGHLTAAMRVTAGAGTATDRLIGLHASPFHAYVNAIASTYVNGVQSGERVLPAEPHDRLGVVCVGTPYWIVMR